MKLKTVYICSDCQYQSPKWVGKCPSCKTWNSFVEDVIQKESKAAPKNTLFTKRLQSRKSNTQKTQAIQSIINTKESFKRHLTGITELDPVLGGGFTPASLTLLSGEPGIGKSTLTLQIVHALSKKTNKSNSATNEASAGLQNILYITGEESIAQVSNRAHRLKTLPENLKLLFETHLETILTLIEKEKPDFLVLDSIQVMGSDQISGIPGSLSQVRYVTESIMHTIKTLGIPTLLIGHVNKDGNIAGPKVLEHLVDTVLLIEGERDQNFRMLRALKNRFGPVSEIGLFEMTEKGLMSIKNPGEKLLKSRESKIGSTLSLSMEGNRPLLIEVEALVTRSHFGYPKRASHGFDRNRLELLIAVMEKYSGISLSDQDIYLNISGGLRTKDPACDLAVCAAILSSFQKKTLAKDLVYWGELSLTGTIRRNHKEEARQKAAGKLGLNAPLIKKISELNFYKSS
jgi:DNA repair protein RadA/Sms